MSLGHSVLDVGDYFQKRLMRSWCLDQQMYLCRVIGFDAAAMVLVARFVAELDFCESSALSQCWSDPGWPPDPHPAAFFWTGQWEEERWKYLWAEVKTGGLLADYCHKQNRLDQQKINLFHLFMN